MASSSATFFCANCGGEFSAPHLGICQTCEAPGLLCEGCFGKHDRTPPLPRFREHVFVKSDHLQHRDELLTFFKLEPSADVCASHKKPLFSFCASHGGTDLLCLDCAGVHVGHPQLSGISDGASLARAELRTNALAKLSTASDVSTIVSSQAAVDLESLNSQWDSAREQINAAREAIFAEATKHFLRITEEAELRFSEIMSAVTDRLQKADVLRDRINAARPHLDRAATVLSDVDVVVHRNSLLTHAQELESEAFTLASSPSPPAVLTVNLSSGLDGVRRALQLMSSAVVQPAEAAGPTSSTPADSEGRDSPGPAGGTGTSGAVSAAAACSHSPTDDSACPQDSHAASGAAGQQAPVSNESLQTRGNLAYRNKDFRGAIELYTQALAMDTTCAPLYHNRAVAHVQLGALEPALSDAQAAIDNDRSYAKAYSTKGTVLARMGRMDDALVAFRAGLEACPGNVGLLERIRESTRSSAPLDRGDQPDTGSSKGQPDKRADCKQQ